MKKILFIIFLIVIQNNILKADFFEIDASETVINFSSYCNIGKITVFIMSQHGCLPCISAKNFFKENYSKNKNVDIYYCLITKNDADLRAFKNRESNIMWGYVETYTSSPRIYFFTPSGNPYGYIDGFDKEKTKNVMNSMIENMSYFNSKLVSFYQPPPPSDDCEKYITEIKNLNSDISSLQKNNELLENENIQLQKTNDDLQKTNSSLNNELENKELKITTLNNYVLQLTNSNEKTEQLLSNTWYNLAKEYEKLIESKQIKKDTKIFIIYQVRLFYENSLKSGKDCRMEYKAFMNEYAKLFKAKRKM